MGGLPDLGAYAGAVAGVAGAGPDWMSAYMGGGGGQVGMMDTGGDVWGSNVSY